MLKKISCLEIILLILLLFLLYFILLKKNTEGFIEQKAGFVRHTNNDVYDKFYSNVYDKILLSREKNQFEIDFILKNQHKNNYILDIGCGTGHHVKLFSDKNIKCLGIDVSKSMINKSMNNYPNLKFKLADAKNTLEFQEMTFSHITCLYFTIYYFKNKQQFLENCFHWLKPGGFLTIHLVNIHKFDPIVPNASEYNKDSKRPTKSLIKFDEFDYKSDFIIDNSLKSNNIILNKSNVKFKEIFKFDNKVRVNQHDLFMNTQQSIIGTARDLGFILVSQVELNKVPTYEHNYLYTLQKPR